MKITQPAEDLKSAGRFHHNQADYYKEKNEKLKKQASEYETERKDFVNRLNKIYELTVSDQADTNKITQIHELTKY